MCRIEISRFDLICRDLVVMNYNRARFTKMVGSELESVRNCQVSSPCKHQMAPFIVKRNGCFR